MIELDLLFQRQTKGKRVQAHGQEWLIVYHVKEDLYLAVDPTQPLPAIPQLIQWEKPKLGNNMEDLENMIRFNQEVKDALSM